MKTSSMCGLVSALAAVCLSGGLSAQGLNSLEKTPLKLSLQGLEAWQCQQLSQGAERYVVQMLQRTGESCEVVSEGAQQVFSRYLSFVPGIKDVFSEPQYDDDREVVLEQACWLAGYQKGLRASVRDLGQLCGTQWGDSLRFGRKVGYAACYYGVAETARRTWQQSWVLELKAGRLNRAETLSIRQLPESWAATLNSNAFEGLSLGCVWAESDRLLETRSDDILRQDLSWTGIGGELANSLLLLTDELEVEESIAEQVAGIVLGPAGSEGLQSREDFLLAFTAVLEGQIRIR